jgi:HlyD family secretion protein
MTQNVVTYTVVVTTDNSDGALKPYLTANLLFEVDRHTQILKVPNSALRWKPIAQQVAPEAQEEFMKGQQRRGKGPGGDQPPVPDTTNKETHNRGTLWVEDNGFVKPIKVKTGLNDGLMTEIVSGTIEEGASVVVGENHATEGGGAVTNPFAPKMFGPRKQQ